MEFCGFLQIARDLPDPDLILMDPKGAEVPTDPATLYALVTALGLRVSDQTAPALLTYAERLPAEFSVVMVRDMSRRDKAALTGTREFQAWATKNHDLLT